MKGDKDIITLQIQCSDLQRTYRHWQIRTARKGLRHNHRLSCHHRGRQARCVERLI